ncbi:ALF repeat-containing protein, partial [Actinoplanes couchii]
MRRNITAGVLMALALLVPAAPAAAHAAAPGLDATCQTVERKLFTDIRKLITIDLDTATDTEIRVVANQIQAAAKADALPVLPGAIQEALDGTAEELKAFLKTGALSAWKVDLRVSVTRTLNNAGPKVKAGAQDVLKDGGTDVMLTWLNEGLYAARALDCAAQPSPSASITSSPSPSTTTSVKPSTSPSTTTTAEPTPSPSTSSSAPGTGGSLPITGSSTGTVAAIGGAL